MKNNTVKKLRVTNNHYGQTHIKTWEYEVDGALYVTDAYGAVWALRVVSEGLEVRACGDDMGRDSIRIHPRGDNQIFLRALRPED